MSTDQSTAPDTTRDEGASKTYVEYWGVDDTRKWFFPDGEQFMEFKVMDEGGRSKFQRMTNQDLTINRDQTAKVRMDPATERHTLIKTSVIDWFLYKNGRPFAFDNSKLENWLSTADPKLVDELEFKIRMANPWLQQDMTVEDIDKEFVRLEEMRRAAVEREAGEADSASK